MQRDACISQDKLYRYTLTRIWNPRSGQRLMGFIMLNPSTSDSNDDDPTIDLCMLTALKYDFDGIYVVNLFAWISPDSGVLPDAPDPVGPDNDEAILEMLVRTSDVRVAAWGFHRTGRVADLIADRIVKVERLIRPVLLWALGLSKDGHPNHPLGLQRQQKPLKPQALENRKRARLDKAVLSRAVSMLASAQEESHPATGFSRLRLKELLKP